MYNGYWSTLLQADMDKIMKDTMRSTMNDIFSKPLPVPDYKFMIPKCVQSIPVLQPQSFIIKPIENEIDINQTTEIMRKAYEEKKKAERVFSSEDSTCGNLEDANG
jgi:hypothetical protein